MSKRYILHKNRLCCDKVVFESFEKKKFHIQESHFDPYRNTDQLYNILLLMFLRTRLFCRYLISLLNCGIVIHRGICIKRMYKHLLGLHTSDRRYRSFALPHVYVSSSLHNESLYNATCMYHLVTSRFIMLFLYAQKARLGIAALPNRFSLYTVLRSPHTDKKSREQFHKIQRRRVKILPRFINPTCVQRLIVDYIPDGIIIRNRHLLRIAIQM